MASGHYNFVILYNGAIADVNQDQIQSLKRVRVKNIICRIYMSIL